MSPTHIKIRENIRWVLTRYSLFRIHPINIYEIPAGQTQLLNTVSPAVQTTTESFELYTPADQVAGAIQTVGTVDADQLVCKGDAS